MGCNERVDKECGDDEKPGKRAEVGAFRIDTTEVTVAAYKKCVNVGACSGDVATRYWGGKERGSRDCNWGEPGRSVHPINCVNWTQARDYCRWAGKRLPSEMEWGKAARGTDGRKYAWGNAGYGSTKVANIADETAKRRRPDWTVAKGYDDGFYGTAPVGSFPRGASPYGVLDMIGNVGEWTSDWYARGKTRSIRGGSWNVKPKGARASNRYGNDPALRHSRVGFRCAQSN